MNIQANIVDLLAGEVFFGSLVFDQAFITDVIRVHDAAEKGAPYLMPGLVDAHIHIESTMLTPYQYSRLAIRHGVLAAVCDPHEIANVKGKDGISAMIDSASRTPFKFMFGAPSCVPATSFETSGASLGAEDVKELLEKREIGFLAEMMNYPGVLNRDEEVFKKIAAAKAAGLPIDGHAPGLRGDDLKKYVEAGISTDHECDSLDEAVEKAKLGMHILIREGSAAKNFETLLPILHAYPEKVMFCTDDSHPDDLLTTYINSFVRRSIARGYGLIDVLRASSLNAVKHYGLDLGLLQRGDAADFIVVDSPDTMNIVACYIDGTKVYDGDRLYFNESDTQALEVFSDRSLDIDELKVRAEGSELRLIGVNDGLLHTDSLIYQIDSGKEYVCSNTEDDVLKIVVVNRYLRDAPPAIAFVHGFGLKKGAIASSVAHDSHNVVCVGVDDASICKAVNWVFQNRGGLVACDAKQCHGLSLPFGGLMSLEPGERVAEDYQNLQSFALSYGSKLRAPFMTLAFMSLCVISELKLSDKGLFDVASFSLVPLFKNS